MKVAMLAGGVGTRLAEETVVKPKPMVEVGGMPILWHIMKIYAHYGHNEFAVALGYRGEYIKKFFVDFCSLQSNLTVDLGASEVHRHGSDLPNWKVDLIDTGPTTATGGRIKRLQPYVGDGTFMLTWGDGVADVNIPELIAFHRAHGKLATVTAVRPAARFGHIEFDGDRVVEFSEKPQTEEGWINGAFFVLEPEIFEYIDGDTTQWELEPMSGLARDGQLMAYRHDSFWQCMDTLRDKKRLDELWATGSPPWRVWDAD
jgi:glucose-1-phosphate cytidylyltransferase